MCAYLPLQSSLDCVHVSCMRSCKHCIYEALLKLQIVCLLRLLSLGTPNAFQYVKRKKNANTTRKEKQRRK